MLRHPVLALALIPGIPAIPFLLLAAITGTGAYLTSRQKKETAARQVEEQKTTLERLDRQLEEQHAVQEELRAERDGTVLSVAKVAVGSVVNAGQQIVSLVQQAMTEKPGWMRQADRIAGPFLWGVLALAAGAAVACQFIDPARSVWVWYWRRRLPSIWTTKAWRTRAPGLSGGCRRSAIRRGCSKGWKALPPARERNSTRAGWSRRWPVWAIVSSS